MVSDLLWVIIISVCMVHFNVVYSLGFPGLFLYFQYSRFGGVLNFFSSIVWCNILPNLLCLVVYSFQIRDGHPCNTCFVVSDAILHHLHRSLVMLFYSLFTVVATV